jgi:hypothetical protein
MARIKIRVVSAAVAIPLADKFESVTAAQTATPPIFAKVLLERQDIGLLGYPPNETG